MALLETAGISSNGIEDLSPLSELQNLNKIVASRNQIVSLTPLVGLREIAELYLDQNQIVDLSPIVANNYFDAGDHMNVENNPLSLLSINEHIVALQERGVSVSY